MVSSMQIADGLADAVLSLVVQGRGGFIQDKELPLLMDRQSEPIPRANRSVAAAPREPRTSLTNRNHQSLVKSRDDILELGFDMLIRPKPLLATVTTVTIVVADRIDLAGAWSWEAVPRCQGSRPTSWTTRLAHVGGGRQQDGWNDTPWASCGQQPSPLCEAWAGAAAYWC